MPFSYKVEPENELLYISGNGNASMEDRYDCVARIMNDQSIDGNLNILINVNRVSNSPSPGDIGSIASLIKTLKSKCKGRVAIVNTVVGHVTVTSLISFSADNEDNSVRAFFFEDEARAWLCSEISCNAQPQI